MHFLIKHHSAVGNTFMQIFVAKDYGATPVCSGNLVMRKREADAFFDILSLGQPLLQMSSKERIDGQYTIAFEHLPES